MPQKEKDKRTSSSREGLKPYVSHFRKVMATMAVRLSSALSNIIFSGLLYDHHNKYTLALFDEF